MSLLIIHTLLDIAEQGKKVIVFYKQKGGEVITPLLKALD